MTTRRPPQEASPLAAEADPSPEIQYLVEPERRMSDLSSEKPDGAKRFSTRGNWHMRPRVGIMGGTFDPIHNGHLVAASEVAWVYDLDEVIFVPTGRPVFKLDKQVTNAEDRYLMTVIATASNPKFTVSRVDIDRPGVTYTIDTLRDLRSQHPDAELFFITGADAVAEIMEGRRPDVGSGAFRSGHTARLLVATGGAAARRQGGHAGDPGAGHILHRCAPARDARRAGMVPRP